MEHTLQNYTSVFGKAADMLQPWSAAAASLPQNPRAAGGGPGDWALAAQHRVDELLVVDVTLGVLMARHQLLHLLVRELLAWSRPQRSALDLPGRSSGP